MKRIGSMIGAAKIRRGAAKRTSGNQRGSVSNAMMIKPMMIGAANKSIIGKKGKSMRRKRIPIIFSPLLKIFFYYKGNSDKSKSPK